MWADVNVRRDAGRELFWEKRKILNWIAHFIPASDVSQFVSLFPLTEGLLFEEKKKQKNPYFCIEVDTILKCFLRKECDPWIVFIQIHVRSLSNLHLVTREIDFFFFFGSGDPFVMPFLYTFPLFPLFTSIPPFFLCRKEDSISRVIGTQSLRMRSENGVFFSLKTMGWSEREKFSPGRSDSRTSFRFFFSQARQRRHSGETVNTLLVMPDARSQMLTWDLHAGCNFRYPGSLVPFSLSSSCSYSFSLTRVRCLLREQDYRGCHVTRMLCLIKRQCHREAECCSTRITLLTGCDEAGIRRRKQMILWLRAGRKRQISAAGPATRKWERSEPEWVKLVLRGSGS